MRVRRLTILGFSLLAVAYLGACGDDGTGPQPTVNSVEVSPATATLSAFGATLQLAAVARDAGGNAISDVTFSWTSNNTTVATVSSSGLVTALSNGPVTITATADGVPGTSEITVEQTVSSVVMTPSAVDSLIGAGDQVQFAAEAQDANGNPVPGSSFTWASSDEGVATVDNMGLVTVVANGTTDITAEEAGGVTGTATFKSATVAAMQMLTIDFTVNQDGTGPHHPMGITSDGSVYYSVYDGGAPSPILTHDLSGNFVGGTTANLDARALLYNEGDGLFYMKPFGVDWYTVDPTNGSVTLALTGIFNDFQSSPAFASGGSVILEHSPAGTVRILDSTTGAETGTITGLTTGGFPSSTAVASDGSFIFTWDGSTAYMYDIAGRLVTSFNIPSGNYGFSLSYANGMLWTTDDVATGTTDGTWYGYEIVQQ